MAGTGWIGCEAPLQPNSVGLARRMALAVLLFSLCHQIHQMSRGMSTGTGTAPLSCVHCGVLWPSAAADIVLCSLWCARRHQLFVDMVRAHANAPTKEVPSQEGRTTGYRPLDLPVYGKEFMSVEAL